MDRGLETGIDRLVVLEHPLRRRLYEHVRNQVEPVTRDDAAATVGISRSLAAFHLDKLVDAGLLRARHDRPRDHGTGPGRNPKRYEPSDVEVLVSLPERRYELVGGLLADALADAEGGETPTAALARMARERGREEAVAAVGGPARSTASPAFVAVLAELGFEPVASDGGDIRLRNCPFRALAERQTELVCGMNLEFVAGILDAIGAEGARPVLDPKPDSCCVRITGGTT